MSDFSQKKITIKSKSPADYARYLVRIRAEAAESRRKAEAKAKALAALKIGDVMADGTIFAGISPDTNKPMYVTPTRSSLLMNFNEAAEYAKDFKIGDKKDFRIPTIEELNILFENREKGALKGTFNLTSDTASWHLSSTRQFSVAGHISVQRFADGCFSFDDGSTRLSVRCVRG